MRIFFGFFFLLSSYITCAETGNLFAVTSNGTGNNISITLCLNVIGNIPLSCQTYITSPGTITIHTTVPNKTYLYAGIIVNTPGYTLNLPKNDNGYSFIGPVSETTSANGIVQQTTSTLSTTNPSNRSVDSGQTATFSTIASGGIPPYSYQWQVSSDNGTTFNNILGANSVNYTTGILSTTENGYQYRVIIKDASNYLVISSPAILTVANQLSASITPSTMSVDINQTATFTGQPVAGIEPYNYQWYSCIDLACSSPSIITGATSITYNAPTTATGTYYYQLQVTDSSSTPVTAITNVATLSVASALSGNITPTSSTVDSGQTALFTANASGGTTPYNYQWYSCGDSNCTTSSEITGATNSTYSPSTSTVGTFYYIVNITDSAFSPSSVLTNIVTLTVKPFNIIFVTTTRYDGNLGGFTGANNKCNSDPGKPGGFAAGYVYKALLDGNNATTAGYNYYRTNGTTLIATATGGNLKGSSTLVNSIATSGNTEAATGAGGVSNCSYNEGTIQSIIRYLSLYYLG